MRHAIFFAIICLMLTGCVSGESFVEKSTGAIQTIVNIISTLTSLAFIIAIPMAFFKKTRLTAGILLYGVSVINGIWLWITCSVIVIQVGWWLFAIGSLFLAVGVLPIALVVTAIRGEWGGFIFIAIITIFVIGIRALGQWLIEKAKKYQDS